MDNVPTTFHEGDRVKLLLWEECDFYGTVKAVGRTIDGENNLVEEDDGSTSWFENRWLRKEEKPKPKAFGVNLEINDFLDSINTSCVLYEDTKHVVSCFKDKFTFADLPELEKQMKHLEDTDCTGHYYCVIKDCIEALKSVS
jgi:hypothetical protein